MGKAYIFLHGSLVLLDQLVHLLGEVVPLVFQLFVQTESVLVNFSLQLVLQSHQLLLMLPPHALVAQHLLPQLRILFLNLASDLGNRRERSYTLWKTIFNPQKVRSMICRLYLKIKKPVYSKKTVIFGRQFNKLYFFPANKQVFKGFQHRVKILPLKPCV